jgi:hypothetical protein
MRLVCAVLLVSSTALAAPAVPPKVVTHAWLTEMHDAKWPIDGMIDWHQGLIVLDRQVDSPADDYKGVVSARKICKPAELHALKRDLTGYYKSADTFNCQNKPDVECSFAYAYEYTTRTTLGFAKADDGTLRLSLVMFLDAGSQSEAFGREQDAWVSKQLTKLSKTTCDTK